MVEKIDQETRSGIMRQVRDNNTKPEKAVRSLLHALGFRFWLHNSALPGKPDICLPKLKTAIFVHGCFWHRHKGCKRATTPVSNTPYWSKKFERNVARDAENARQLKKEGWKVVTVWECELKNSQKLSRRLAALLKAQAKKP